MAIAAVVGDTLRTYIVYTQPDDSPVTGATFTVESALRPDGSPFAADVIVSERGNGVYDVTAPTQITDPAGEYLLVIRSDIDDSLFQEVGDTFTDPATIP